MSGFCQHCRTQLDRHPRTKICHILLRLDLSAQSIYRRIAQEKHVKMGLSYRKLFALPKLQTRQKFRSHVYVRRQFRELKHTLKEVKDRRYKLKAAQGR